MPSPCMVCAHAFARRESRAACLACLWNPETWKQPKTCSKCTRMKTCAEFYQRPIGGQYDECIVCMDKTAYEALLSRTRTGDSDE